MAKEHQLPIFEALKLANEVMALLKPACERIQIAGSIRREKAMIGDIEIVCIPRIDQVANAQDLFGDTLEPISAEFELCKTLRAEGVFSDRLDVNDRPCFGEKYQRLTYKGFGLDVFCCSPEQWGVTLAIRTGNAEFSRKLVTPKWQGGFMLPGQSVKGWRIHDRGVTLDTPEETDVFKALGMTFIDPIDRNPEGPVSKELDRREA